MSAVDNAAMTQGSEPPRHGHPGAAPTGWQSEGKYRTLFDSIDEGFCVV